VTLFYTLAVVSARFHLRHGAFSAFRSLGQQTPNGDAAPRTAALVFAVALTVSYLVVPFAVLTGLVR
jgi:succinate dehydrogenase / fumarate reductase cytochrome b subunit